VPADAPPADLDAEREIDLGEVGRRILRLWWLVVAAAAAGVVIGYLVSLGGGTVYQARATLYLGQPLTAAGSAQLQSYQTNPSIVNQIARSDDLVARVAEQVGLGRERLRNGISTRAVSGSLARLGQTPLVELAVRGADRAKVEQAANLLAAEVVGQVSALSVAKIERLTDAAEKRAAEIEQLQEAVATYTRRLEREGIGEGEAISLTGLVTSLNQRLGQLETDQTDTQLDLAVAQEVEQGQVLREASATKVAARSRRSGMVVGGVIGLVVGVVLALAVPALRRRPVPGR
jgi:capsular polysaccharide biosynthesis protein